MLGTSAVVGWFESWTVGLPETVALAAVATLAYLFGRRSRPHLDDSLQQQAQRDLHRAVSIARQLEGIASAVRKELADHHQSVLQFKSRLAAMGKSDAETSCQALCDQAEQILAPTLRLAAQLSHAYDQIRQQSAQLLTFTEVRTDPLTGAGNRRALDEQLKVLFGLLGRYDRPFSLAIFDIDHFQRINEREGHGFGDQLLQDISRLFKEYVRETDFVARFGGEEFVVVMPQTRLAGASVFGERLRSHVEQQLQCTVSGGVAEARPEDAAQNLLSRADSALYSAKAAGRNAVYQHNGTVIRAVERQSASETTLAPGNAAAEQELQPTAVAAVVEVDAATRELVESAT